MRLHFFALLCEGLALLAAPTAAPVPKRKPVAELTPALIEGTWLYSWGGFPDGVIGFNRDGTYSALHQPAGTTVYYGTWTVTRDTVVIEEMAFDPTTGAVISGAPTRYEFTFDPKTYPKLSGVSNGTVEVKLWGRQH